MMLAGEAGAVATAGAGGVTTAAVVAFKLVVETAGVAGAMTVNDALVVGNVAAASCGRDDDAAGALVLARLTETFEAVTPRVDEPAAKDLPGGVGVKALESVPLVDGVEFVAAADDDAEVCSGVDAVVERSEPAVVAALLIEIPGLDVAVVSLVVDVAVVSLVVDVAMPFTEVLAPPEACTTPVCGSVDDPD
jgi:hypothetical protein